MPTNREIAHNIILDLRAYAEHEGTTVNAAFVARMVLLTVGFQFVLARRLQDFVYNIPLVGRLLRRILWWFTCFTFSSELAIGAEIEGGLYIPHPYGIVVGRCRICRNVTLLQNVTIGKKKGEKSTTYPLLHEGTVLSAGSIVLGAISIGPDAVVGAQAIVLHDVPRGVTVVGQPAREIRRSPCTKERHIG